MGGKPPDAILGSQLATAPVLWYSYYGSRLASRLCERVVLMTTVGSKVTVYLQDGHWFRGTLIEVGEIGVSVAINVGVAYRGTLEGVQTRFVPYSFMKQLDFMREETT
jgi:hypothetical protein